MTSSKAQLVSAAAAATIAFSVALPASAAYYSVNLKGVLVSELGYAPNPLNAGIDPTFDVGTEFTLSARFSDTRISALAGGGSVAGLYGLPTTGDEFWRIDAAGLTWTSTDDMFDGFEFGDGDAMFAQPAIYFSGGKVTGLAGDLVPPGTSRPVFYLSSFRIEPGEGLYGNIYDSQGFQGQWDYANSSVGLSAIPEPATWAMMIVGFGLVGSTVRGRRQSKLASC